MTCDTAVNLIHAYADGELESADTPMVEAHLRTCTACADYLARVRSLQDEIRREYRYAIPGGLEGRVRSSLQAASFVRAEARPKPRLRWLFALPPAVALASVLFLWLPYRSQNAITDDVISGHVRSLMQSHIVDVPSSDQHTVKPWFNGKVDFSPAVKDLTTAGFPLVGGRLDYLGGRPVAAVVYRRRQHIINVFIWPAQRGSGPARASSQKGYNVVNWAAGGLSYWAVSDLNSRELADFVHLLQ